MKNFVTKQTYIFFYNKTKHGFMRQYDCYGMDKIMKISIHT